MIKKLNKLRETAKKFIKPSGVLGGLFIFLRSLSMKSLTSLIIASLSILLLLMAQFTSCSSNNGLTTSSSRTTPSTSTSNSNNDDEPDIEDCSDRDSCEEECSKIYEDYGEKTECEDEDVDDVVELGHIYNKLKSGSYSELQDISNNNDDVDTDMLQNYLNIGTSGWIKKIQCWGDGDGCTKDATKLKKTIKWIVENENIAEILLDLDEDGQNVLEELLLSLNKAIPNTEDTAPLTNTLADDAKSCITSGRYTHGTTWGRARFNLSTSSSEMTVITGISPNKGEFTFDGGSTYSTLYQALSCQYTEIADSSHTNIFSYSAHVKEGNQYSFEMAYNLLNKACEEAEGTTEEKGKAVCRKAMFCFVRNKASSDSTLEGSRFFGSYANELKVSGSNINFDDCAPSAFAHFF